MTIISVDRATKQRVWGTRIFLAIVSGAGLWLLWRQSEMLDQGLNISYTDLVLLMGIKMLATTLNAMKFYVLTKMFGLALSVKEWMGLSVVTTFYSYISGQIGHIPRAYYLRKQHRFVYSHYLSLITGLNLLGILVSSVVGLGAMWQSSGISHATMRTIYSGFTGTFILAILGTAAVLSAGYLQFRIPFPWLDAIVRRFQDGLRLFRDRPLMTLILLGLLLLSTITGGMGLYVSFTALGFRPVFPVILMTECLVSLMTVISLTPANLGIREGGIVSIAVLSGISASQALPASVLSRLGAMLVHFALGIAFSYALFGRVYAVSGKESLK